MMRIGVVCEGPTDFIVIESFVKAFLSGKNIDSTIVSIQPDMDNTREYGGWANLLIWLKNNPPQLRVKSYFGSGLFDAAMSAKACDVILIQMDSDILGHESFENYVRRELNYSPSNPVNPSDRANEIKIILNIAANLGELSAADNERHILGPTVESTETWCVAAYSNLGSDPEFLSGQALIDAFMNALLASESQPSFGPYSSCDKTVKRRSRFCEKHANGVDRLVASCSQFRQISASLIDLSVRFK